MDYELKLTCYPSNSGWGVPRLTLEPHNTADHHDVSLSPPLHAWKHSFDQTDSPKKVGVEHVLHSSQAEFLQGPHEADSCVVH